MLYLVQRKFYENHAFRKFFINLFSRGLLLLARYLTCSCTSFKTTGGKFEISLEIHFRSIVNMSSWLYVCFSFVSNLPMLYFHGVAKITFKPYQHILNMANKVMVSKFETDRKSDGLDFRPKSSSLRKRSKCSVSIVLLKRRHRFQTVLVSVPLTVNTDACPNRLV